jgi:hypothetical protein
MFTRYLLPSVAAVLLAAGVLSAADAQAPMKTVAPEVINTTCPMDGQPIDAHAGMAPIVVGEGAQAKHYHMAFCSAACCTAFTTDPAPVLKGKFAPGPKTNGK